MIPFKCKMCGGDLRFNAGATTCACAYCGTMQTLPKLDSDRRANLYDRANHFRRQNEFDKAADIYEQILREDRTDAEAYWSLVLCRYGVEYVEDPATHRRLPTVNRTQLISILADDDYRSALRYADDAQRAVYEAEAARIEAIQKDILEISRREEPFDVFICYKETDEQGRRTPDSVLAMDMYNALKREGFKVFFSRITLEDKLGIQYEPYIYAALNSASVMVVLGTRPEYFRAVWVKNEWSRYLALIKAGQDKTLVPAYKDMDPYDMPEEFSHLQALDMGRLGFMQDLIHGIRKLCRKQENQTHPQPGAPRTGNAAGAAPGIRSLMDRAWLFMEDGDYDSAAKYLERVLDIDAKYAPAYAAKTCVTLKLARETDLAETDPAYENDPDWKKALRFADPKQLMAYEGYIRSARQKVIYRQAMDTWQAVHFSSKRLHEVADLFDSIADYKDAKAQAEKCRKEAAELSEKSRQLAEARCANLYAQVIKAMEAAGDDSSKWNDVKKKLANAELDGYRDVDPLRKKAAERYAACVAADDERRRQEEEKRRRKEAAAAKKKRHTVLAFLAAALVMAGLYAVTQVIIPDIRYRQANEEKLKPYRTVGGYVTFGSYPQTKAGTDRTPIQWQVLDYDEDNARALLISRYGLDVQPYHLSYADVTWAKCTLDAWLNKDFLDRAFSEKEQKAILMTAVDNSQAQGYDGSQWKGSGGSNTWDRVFLLSYAEANRYMGVMASGSGTASSRMAPTAYARQMGAYTSAAHRTPEGADTGWWWLRSPGTTQYRAACVLADGTLDDDYVNYSRACIRPALWLNLKMMVD